MSGLLYFPYISIPDTPWLTRSLLYWDEVAAIVPYDFIDNPQGLTPFMRNLVEAQLVRQVFPEQYTWQIRDFEDNFLSYLEQDPQFGGFLQMARSGAIFRTQPIHSGKLSRLGCYLERLGLAKSRHDAWYDVHAAVAAKFMSYLAVVIGLKTDLQPATDRLAGLKHIVLRGPRRPGWSPVRDSDRTEILKEILPVPDHISDFDTLLRIRRDHGPMLHNFRAHVERFLLDLDAAPSSQRAERKRLFIESSSDERRHIEEIIRDQRWSPLSFVSLASLGSAGITFAQAFSSGAPDVWTAVSGGLSVLAAVAGIFDRTELEQKLMEHPLAYGVLAEKRLGSEKRALASIRTPLEEHT